MQRLTDWDALGHDGCATPYLRAMSGMEGIIRAGIKGRTVHRCNTGGTTMIILEGNVQGKTEDVPSLSMVFDDNRCLQVACKRLHYRSQRDCRRLRHIHHLNPARFWQGHSLICWCAIFQGETHHSCYPLPVQCSLHFLTTVHRPSQASYPDHTHTYPSTDSQVPRTSPRPAMV